MKKIKDIPTGEFFNRQNTPTYPKIKTLNGYLDFRDEIINDNPGDWEVIPMTTEDVAKIFDISHQEFLDEVSIFKKRFSKKF